MKERRRKKKGLVDFRNSFEILTSSTTTNIDDDTTPGEESEVVAKEKRHATLVVVRISCVVVLYSRGVLVESFVLTLKMENGKNIPSLLIFHSEFHSRR